MPAAYDGFEHFKDSTLRQIASIYGRLPIQVIQEIGDIV